MEIQKYIDLGVRMTIAYLPQLLLSIVVLLVGLWVINRMSKIFRRGMELRGVDVSLRSFLSSLVSIGLKVLLLFTVADMIGIQTTSFIAILGAAGLAIGLALQGTLANFAGGVLILIFHPYRVGDVIETQAQTGTVKEIQIFNTILQTAEGKTVILPNGAVSNSTLVNQTMAGALSFSILLELDYSNTFEKIKQALLPVLQTDARITNPVVKLSKLGAGSITVTVSGVTKPGDSGPVQAELLESIKIALTSHQIILPRLHSFVHTVTEPST